MAQLIRLPNNHEISFPDGMSDAEIASVIHREYPEYAPQNQPDNESKGLSGVAGDAFSKAIETAFSLPASLAQLPSEAYGAGSQIINNPKRALQNVGAGFGELGHGILSAPGNIRDYLQRKDLVSKNAPSFRLPESVLPKEYNYAEALGAKGEESGDALLRSVASGLAAAPLAEVGASLTAKIPSISTKGITKKIVSDKKAIKGEYKKLYNHLFENAEKQGIKDVEIPKIKGKLIIENSVPKYHTALKNFLSEPSLKNAHKAQSDLGKMERALEKSNTINPLSTSQHKTLRAAKEAKEKIKEAMFAKNKLGSNNGLGDLYNKITEGYRKEVVPYTSKKPLTQFENKEIGYKKTLQKLRNDDKFMMELGKKYPGIKINKLLNSKGGKRALYGLLTGGGAAVGFKEGKKLFD